MKLNFKKIIIENFLSIGNAEINLQDRGFTLVNGMNNNPKDLALSNGSGKSSIFEAISWSLTGETIRGIKDVVNMFSEGGTMVQLHFDVDKDTYIVSRYKDHKKYKTDLKILINGEDKSGKGVRDSQKLLESYLPDLTPSLLGSVILLGQGLPQRFTNNTPSGRKDVLEKLSKSDFMIEDLKSRLTSRKSDLSSLLREKEDLQLITKTKINTLESQIKSQEDKLNSMEDPKIYVDIIERAKNHLLELVDKVDELKSKADGERIILDKLLSEKSDIINKFNDKKRDEDVKFIENKSTLESSCRECYKKSLSIQEEIQKAKSVKEFCPTCGRKFDNVFIPDTTELENTLLKVKKEYEDINIKLNAVKSDHDTSLINIDNEMNNLLQDVNKSILEHQAHLSNYERSYSSYTSDKLNEEKSINKYEMMLSNYETTIQTISNTIRSDKQEVEKLREEIVYNSVSIDNINERLSVVNKFILMTTRDFRGYLLKNVIKYIDNRAKEYCRDVFDTDELDFILDGNNIDIKYCGKYMESLSGGEKQKIDLIIQFSIRDMLCQFLNFRSNIIALDEIFDALDSVSCDKMVDLISKKLSDVDSVFIITHHKELGIPSDSIITVTKQANGVSTVI